MAKGALETTSPKLGMPRKLRWSANMWYDCGCGILGNKKSTTATITVITNSTVKPVRREINLLSYLSGQLIQDRCIDGLPSHRDLGIRVHKFRLDD